MQSLVILVFNIVEIFSPDYLTWIGVRHGYQERQRNKDSEHQK